LIQRRRAVIVEWMIDDEEEGTPIGVLRPTEVPAFSLSVVDGPVLAGVSDVGLALTIDGTRPSRAHLGKSPVASLRLRDPKVSRNHVSLDVIAGRLRVTDTGSTNGTFLNGVLIREAHAFGGETLRIGDTTLRIDASAPLVFPATSDRFGPLLGTSLEMRRLYPLLERLAASDVPLVIEGETGTGKEVVAEAIHAGSARAKREFVVFDCTAVAPNLMEAALFGHERGAFTGAVGSQPGVFEQADGGTLLLDEIGDLDVALQPKLLRAIERSEIRRVGGTRWIHVDVRVMGATRRDLEREIQLGRFRDDLFYRLAVARVELPPLRERHGDVRFLTRHFWDSVGGGAAMPHDFFAKLEAYDWPGNVRELRNVVARRLALGDLAPPPGAPPSRTGTRASLGSVPPSSLGSVPSSSLGSAPSVPSAPGSDAEGLEEVLSRALQSKLPLSAARDIVVQEFERRYLQKLLVEHGGDATSAARSAGVARRYFQLLRGKRGL
jgi:transcriptional regulator with GAF, ATPase, and Fis domain